MVWTLIHCLSVLHVLTLAIGYLVIIKLSTSVRRCFIPYTTPAAFRGTASKGGAGVVATACSN